MSGFMMTVLDSFAVNFPRLEDTDESKKIEGLDYCFIGMAGGFKNIHT